MSVALTSTEHTAILQGWAKLEPGERYYVELKSGWNQILWLWFTSGPFLHFVDSDENEYRFNQIELEKLERM